LHGGGSRADCRWHSVFVYLRFMNTAIILSIFETFIVAAPFILIGVLLFGAIEEKGCAHVSVWIIGFIGLVVLAIDFFNIFISYLKIITIFAPELLKDIKNCAVRRFLVSFLFNN